MSCFGLLRSSYTHILGSNAIRRGVLAIVNSKNTILQLVLRNHSTNSKNIQRLRQDDKEVLYRYKWIKQLRLISRVKILHVLIVSGLTGPMCVWYINGIVAGPVLFTTIFAASATTTGLFALSYFFRRVIGELSYDKTNDKVTISSLTFWGNRRDTVLPVAGLVPLCERGFSNKNLFHRVERYGDQFVYLLNLRHGKIYNYERLQEVLGLDSESSGVKQSNIRGDAS